jgi:hypothetical protein
MLKIEQNGYSFAVHVSEPGTGWRGYKVEAEDLDELHNAIDHYFRGMHRKPGEPCPLCREQARATAR